MTPRNSLLEKQVINYIRNSVDWRKGKPERVKIKNERVKEIIKKMYPNTNINHWKKEYLKYTHKDGYVVDIHRFVNTNDERQEFNVKIKIAYKEIPIEKLIAITTPPA